MKKIYSLVALIGFSFCAFAQIAPVYLINEDFTNYNGTVAPANIFLSINLPGTSTSTFYSSSLSSGASGPNSLKFRYDSMYLSTADMGHDADSVRFWMKGNSTDTISSIELFSGPDTNSLTLLQTIDHISSSASILSFPLKTYDRVISMLYHKSAGNVAIDELAVFYNGTVGLEKKKTKQLSKIEIEPNPSLDGKFKVRILDNNQNSNVMVVDVLGKTIANVNSTDEVIPFDLSNQSNGIYFIKITSGDQTTIRKVLVK